MTAETDAVMWNSPPSVLTLNTGEVHVWRADLNISTPRIRELYEHLSADEHARAQRFYFLQHRQHFIVGRGFLRGILGRYLGVSLGQLRFDYAPGGKPFLANECGGEKLNFNLSHSEAVALYAVIHPRTSQNIGVDIERIKPEIIEERVAEHFFSPREVAALRSLPPNAQPQGFFNCWTRKEAYVKAMGEGLALALDQFDVSLVPGEPAALFTVLGNSQEAHRWSVRELFPGAGYAGALAIKANDIRVRCWQWTSEM